MQATCILQSGTRFFRAAAVHTINRAIVVWYRLQQWFGTRPRCISPTSQPVICRTRCLVLFLFPFMYSSSSLRDTAAVALPHVLQDGRCHNVGSTPCSVAKKKHVSHPVQTRSATQRSGSFRIYQVPGMNLSCVRSATYGTVKIKKGTLRSSHAAQRSAAQRHAVLYRAVCRSHKFEVHVRTWHKCKRRQGCLPGALSSWHLRVACLHLDVSDHLSVLRLFFLPSERA